MKVAVIGAGSVGFTRKLIRDLLKVPELQATEFALHDINPDNLAMIAQIMERWAQGLTARHCVRQAPRREFEQTRNEFLPALRKAVRISQDALRADVMPRVGFGAPVLGRFPQAQDRLIGGKGPRQLRVQRCRQTALDHDMRIGLVTNVRPRNTAQNAVLRHSAFPDGSGGVQHAAPKSQESPLHRCTQETSLAAGTVSGMPTQ